MQALKLASTDQDRYIESLARECQDMRERVRELRAERDSLSDHCYRARAILESVHAADVLERHLQWSVGDWLRDAGGRVGDWVQA